jgi:Nucleotidyltransferase substrate binding protein like
MAIDITSLRNAMAQLETAISYANSALAASDPGLREQLRNSVIQCFGFTYELSHKMLKRYLESTAAKPKQRLLLLWHRTFWPKPSSWQPRSQRARSHDG